MASETVVAPIEQQFQQRAGGKIPLAMKIVYTLFCGVLVPYYWRAYGPANFMYFCDVALLATLVGLWTESRLLISMQGVAILLPQAIWIVDFASMAILGKSPLGMTEYMFDRGIPIFVRGLSSFHMWLPILLVWLIWQLRYDRRAFPLEILCGWVILLISYFLLSPPPAPPTNPAVAVNVNYVYGLSDARPQTWMHLHLWFAMLMVLFPVGIFLPTHLVLNRLFARSDVAQRVPIESLAKEG